MRFAFVVVGSVLGLASAMVAHAQVPQAPQRPGAPQPALPSNPSTASFDSAAPPVGVPPVGVPPQQQQPGSWGPPGGPQPAPPVWQPPQQQWGAPPPWQGQFQPPLPPQPPPPPPRWRVSDPGLAIGVERVAGLYFYGFTVKQKGLPETSTGGTMVNFLWGNASTSEGGGAVNPYAIPNLSIHGVFGPGVTAGGSLGYMSTSADSEQIVASNPGLPTKEKVELPTRTAFVFAPRAGFLLPVTDVVAFWFRGGVVYYSLSAKTPAGASTGFGVTNFGIESSETGIGLSLDPMLVLTPIPHVGFLVGPVLDFGVSGSYETTYDDPNAGATTTNADVGFSNYGLAVGVAIFL